jgi:hypothetical protein
LLLLLAACGSEAAAPTPYIDFSDYRVRPADAGQSQGDADLSSLDGRVPDDGADQGVMPPDQGASEAGGDCEPEAGEAEIADAAAPVVCIPWTTTCRKGDVVRCNSQGTDYELLEDCNDSNPCTNDQCLDALCEHSPVEGACCFPECGVGEFCVAGQCLCAPQCLGKECGDDGCGGSCGECQPGFSCSLGGQCQCIPSCDGKQCGDDGCGGSCGECVQPWICQDSQCVCVPSCQGKSCGEDGCGGSCGGCPELNACVDGACQYFCPYCPTVGACAAYPYAGHVYYFCPSNPNWDDARKACENHGTHLATITSPDENAFLKSKAAGNTFWIGLYQPWWAWGEWHWVTDEKLEHKNWAKDQPDDGSIWTVEDCVEMYGSGQWNDNECGTGRFFICEYEP